MLKNRITLFVFAITFGLFESAVAIPLNVKIGSRHTIDPESGDQKLEIQNPSGTAEMSFIDQGLRFKFVDSEQREKTFRVYFEYQHAEFATPDPESQQLIWSTVQSAQQAGSNVAGKILKQLLAQPTGAEIFFNLKGKAGFVHTDFAASSVEIQIQEAGVKATNLKNLAFEALLNSHAQLMAAEKAQQAQHSEASQVKKNPIGYIWEDVATTTSKTVCAAVISESEQ